MRRILLWFLTTVSTVVLLFGYRTSTSSALPTGTTPGTDSTASGTTRSTGSAAPTGTTAAPPTTGSRAAVNATVTGSTAATRWGPVQVQVTVAAGRITAVTLLQQPDGNPKDRQINADAVPTLVQETLTAQSAKIDMVSGATVTSTGYVQSLQSALDQAGIA